MKTCRICFYSRIFLLMILFLVILVLLNEDLLNAFRGLSPKEISIYFISALGLAAVLKKLLEYVLIRKKN
jgi:disulfide bond formation protein DsbB